MVNGDGNRERLQQGDIVKFRNPTPNVGVVEPVNKDSVWVRYPNPRHSVGHYRKEPKTRIHEVPRDSDALELLDVETLEEAQEQVMDDE